jgi:hypothetical protein
MTGRPPKEVLGLQIPFGEAMEHFIAVDPNEMHANIAKSRKKKVVRQQDGRTQPQDDGNNVVPSRDRKTAQDRRGREVE